MRKIECEWEFSLFYNKSINKMTDEDGNVCLDIFRLISPNTYYLFKVNKKDTLVHTLTGKLIGLIYP